MQRGDHDIRSQFLIVRERPQIADRDAERVFDLGARIGSFTASNLSGVLAFAVLVAALYSVGTTGKSAVSATKG